MRILFRVLLGLSTLLCSQLWASTTIVGNGNFGNDLEGLVPITEGRILETRLLALEKLQKLNVSGIMGLGYLEAELKSSEIYMASKEVLAELESDQGAYHANMGGQVYARTVADRSAATRFFPVSLELSDDQLVALHIHEALHRALHVKIREDESIVAQITLAITLPSSTYDSVKSRMEKIYKDPLLSGSERSIK